MAVVTISRQYGSGGHVIAGKVANLLDYRLFDKELIATVAASMGLPDHEILDYTEADFNARRLRERLMNLFYEPAGESVTPPEVVSRLYLDDAANMQRVEAVGEGRAVAVVRQAIFEAHRHDNVVIVGRGSQIILKGQPAVLHVRVEAPLDTRAARIAERENVSLQRAEELIDEWDRVSADYVRRFYKVDVSDVMFYHLVINTGYWDLNTAARLIVDAVGHLPE